MSYDDDLFPPNVRVRQFTTGEDGVQREMTDADLDAAHDIWQRAARRELEHQKVYGNDTRYCRDHGLHGWAYPCESYDAITLADIEEKSKHLPDLATQVAMALNRGDGGE